jgi:hypothetical protein
MLGWAVAESILMRLAPLWIGARQLEFSWEYIQMSIEANFSLVRTSQQLSRALCDQCLCSSLS